MKNPILSMTGNMWAALRRVRSIGLPVNMRPFASSLRALATRGLIRKRKDGFFVMTNLGVMVCDAFTEGQESVK